jgi:hypothetical protein
MEALPDKTKLEDLCNLRQPLVFDYFNEEYSKCTQFAGNAFELNVVDPSNVTVPLSAEKAVELFSKSPHYTENNSEFLKDTMMSRVYEQNDYPLRPPLVAHIKYDILFGGKGATTKLKYSDCYRNYFLVADGNVEVKVAPPRSSRFLNTQKDYLRGEFYSMMNPWSTDPLPNEYAKVKCLTLKLQKGKMLFLPAYWWYSFKFDGGTICSFHYKTMMNMVATLPDVVVGVMQRQNTKMIVANQITV